MEIAKTESPKIDFEGNVLQRHRYVLCQLLLTADYAVYIAATIGIPGCQNGNVRKSTLPAWECG